MLLCRVADKAWFIYYISAGPYILSVVLMVVSHGRSSMKPTSPAGRGWAAATCLVLFDLAITPSGPSGPVRAPGLMFLQVAKRRRRQMQVARRAIPSSAGLDV